MGLHCLVNVTPERLYVSGSWIHRISSILWQDNPLTTLGVRWLYTVDFIKIVSSTETIYFPESADCWEPQPVAYHHAMKLVQFRRISLHYWRRTGKSLYGDIMALSMSMPVSVSWSVSMFASVLVFMSVSVPVHMFSVDTDMQNGYGKSAWTLTCSMHMNMLHAHRYAMWIWTCIVDLKTQHGHGHCGPTAMDTQNHMKWLHRVKKTAVESFWPDKTINFA